MGGRRKSSVGLENENIEQKRSVKLQIAQCKSKITKAENLIRDQSRGPLDKEALDLRLAQLKVVLSSINELALQQQLLENNHDDDIFDDDGLEERCLDVMLLYKRALTQTSSTKAVADVQGTSGFTPMKLPDIDIPVFDGKDYAKYQTFIELFNAVINKNCKLEPIQKLCYLRKFLKAEPLSLIESLPLINGSYEKALDLLKHRYDNKFLVITNHVQALLDFPAIVKGTASNLREFVSHARQHLCALDTLGQSTNQCEMFILPILMRKIDQFTCRAFHSERDESKMPNLIEFFAFVERRASSFEESQRSEGKNIGFQNFSKTKVSNIASVVSACRFCDSMDHKLFKCAKFLASSYNDKIKFASHNNLCKICLGFHNNNKCHFHFKCSVCNSKEHNTILHFDKNESKASLHSNISKSTILLPTIKAKILSHDNKSYFIVRGIVDTGSQISFIKSDIVQKLKLQPFENNLNITAVGQQNISTTKAVEINFISLHSGFSCQVNCSIVDRITSKLPQSQLDVKNIQIPEGVVLSDDEYGTPGDISFLLSADVFFKIILPNKIQLANNLYLMNSEFGSFISGEIKIKARSSFNNNLVTLHAETNDIDKIDHLLTKFWDTEKVPEIQKEVIEKPNFCEAAFKESVQLVNGHFQVSLPLKQSMDQLNLGNTFPSAAKTLSFIEKRLDKDVLLGKNYHAFMNEYINLGHAKVLPLNFSEVNKRYFMQHLPVIRNDKKSSKLRVVFNGNTRSNSQCNSLNDVLENGPKLQKDLFEILVLFRSYKFVILTDIRHMYRAVYIHPSHRVLQNILWKDQENKTIIIELQTVTYGLKSSSYLATRCLEELAQRYSSKYPKAAEVIRNSMYVDDALFGGQSVDEALEVRDQFIALLERANFILHKWAANDPQLLDGIPLTKQQFDEHELCNENLSMKALGLSYDTKNDTLKVGCPSKNLNEWSKRSILSVIGSFFDPLGLAGPIVVKAKIFLQKLWIERVKWDAPVPEQLLKQWISFYNKLLSMPDMYVNRYVNCSNADRVELLGYCDASNAAYGCCIYVKTIHNSQVTSSLLCARSKIAPLKNKLTVPKLELNAALLLAKMYNRVINIFSNIKIDANYMFSDSIVVLCWLQSNRELPRFVRNRVNVIQTMTANCEWLHVAGEANPSDILSRGCDPSELSNNNLWWNGSPQHLVHNYSPQSALSCNHSICGNEDDRQVGLEIIHPEPELPTILTKYSSWQNTVRVISWLFRFDQNSLLRVGGRLRNAQIPYSQKHPIILPKKCHITDLIISNEHLLLLHAGAKLTMSNLSLRYWIINCSREVKRILNKCITCYRFRAEAAEQVMGSMPPDRVTQADTFSIVGIDYCGPFQIRQSRLRRSIVTKGYVAVFVCFVTKCVHLELVSDMSTQSFIASLKRFTARRGLPSVIHCDNAKTFKGAENVLNDLYKLHNSKPQQSAVIDFASKLGIKFDYIPAYSPTFGGLWEAAVKSAKFHFKRIIGPNIFTYEEFNTIIISVEGILNSRPLTSLTRDPTDMTFLTPGHFLMGRPISAIPEPDITTIPAGRLRFWRQCTQIQQSFWKVWHKQYLSQLNNRPKWHKNLPNIEEGSLVLIRDESSAPLHWPLGRVIKIFIGSDDRARVADVKLASGKVTRRGINKLCVLPLGD